MGKYDDISAERLRADLVRFAELVLRLDAEEGLLQSPADLQTILGELRQKLFAWEVRSSRRLAEPSREDAAGEARPRVRDDPQLRESLRIVKEALRREEELIREWEEGPDQDEDDDDVGPP